MMPNLIPSERTYHLKAFRQARVTLLEDSEAYIDAFVCLENLGRRLHKPTNSFLKFKSDLIAPLVEFLAPHASVIYPEKDTAKDRVKALLNRLGDARNEAVHGGAYARHLGMGCIEASLIAEEALAEHMNKVSDFMVTSVATAELWQPLAYARQLMLKNSFTWLPIETAEGWKLLSDVAILRACGSPSEKQNVLKTTIEELIKNKKVTLQDATATTSTDSADSARETLIRQSGPLLVIDKMETKEHLVGILMAFDLL